ncbi:MAG: DUF72 domain-containing protein [Acidobacteria bacterium]|nr:DUF72 domain-containing protein [Acidobacteriota bacterium]
MPRAPQAALPDSVTAQAAASTRIFGGTSGWAYPTWKPAFYPDKLPTKRFLEFYATQLSSVEVNYTFRALPTATMLENWLAATPDFFRFSFKAPQRITHIKRLANVEADVAYFVSALEPVRQAGKLGLLLFQLPPNMKADVTRLTAFLATPALRAAGAPAIAFEFRHESWFTGEIYDVMRANNAALCIAESDGLATPEVHTASTHTSFRLRRTGAYTQAEIESFAARFSALAKDRDTYIYFKHEDEPTGALNAVSFLEALRKQAHG